MTEGPWLKNADGGGEVGLTSHTAKLWRDMRLVRENPDSCIVVTKVSHGNVVKMLDYWDKRKGRT